MSSRAAGYAAEAKPCIISIGLTIHNAPVEIREKLAIPEAEWPRAIEELTAFPHIEEAAVLSTCNRMEMYVVGLSWHRGVREIEEWMSCMSGVPLEELRPYLFLKRNRDATWHLLRVASGLDSLVMGEGQILAQVKQVRSIAFVCTCCTLAGYLASPCCEAWEYNRLCEARRGQNQQLRCERRRTLSAPLCSWTCRRGCRCTK